MKLNNVNKNTGEGCPDCTDGYLVERVNGNTKNTFLGCSEWPDCEYTKRGGENPSPVKSSSYYSSDEYDDDPYNDSWFDGEF